MLSMAGYDKSLDKELFSKELEFEGTKIKVSVFSYNENKPKLQIGRENFNPTVNEFRFAKLGRLTKEEAEQVIPVMKEALEQMKE